MRIYSHAIVITYRGNLFTRCSLPQLLIAVPETWYTEYSIETETYCDQWGGCSLLFVREGNGRVSSLPASLTLYPLCLYRLFAVIIKEARNASGEGPLVVTVTITQ